MPNIILIPERTTQTSEKFIQDLLRAIVLNERQAQTRIADAITLWIAGGFGIGQPWLSVVAAIVELGVENCFNPTRHADSLIQQIEARDPGIIQQIPSVKDVRLPAGAKTIPATASTSATGMQVNMAPLVIPYTQTVKVKWNIWAHAAVCHEDITRVEIITNQGGQKYVPFAKQTRGAYKFPFETITTQDKGETQIQLPAGGYILRAITSCQYSGANIAVEYNRIEAMPLMIPPPVLIGAGIGLLAIGTYILIRR